MRVVWSECDWKYGVFNCRYINKQILEQTTVDSRYLDLAYLE